MCYTHYITSLPVTDVLIVIVGGLLSNTTILISSFVGLLVKTLGIDLAIFIIKKLKSKSKEGKQIDC